MNKLLIVTGGTKGIGKAIVEKFASKGHDIVTCARDESNLKTLEKTIKNKFKNILLYFIVT